LCTKYFCKNKCLTYNIKLAKYEHRLCALCPICHQSALSNEISLWLDKSFHFIKQGCVNTGLNLLHLVYCFHEERNVINLVLGKLNSDLVSTIHVLFDLINIKLSSNSNFVASLDLSMLLFKLADKLKELADYDQHKAYELLTASYKVLFLMDKTNEAVITRMESVRANLKKFQIELKQSQLYQKKTNEIKVSLTESIQNGRIKEVFDYLIDSNSHDKGKQLALKEFFENFNCDFLHEKAKWTLKMAHGIFKLVVDQEQTDLKEKIIGFKQVENVYWNTHAYGGDEFAEIYMNTLLYAVKSGVVFPMECALYAKNLFDDMLIPHRDSLRPLSQKLFSMYSTKNSGWMKKYEDAISYNMANKQLMNWTYENSIFSYIDLIDACTSISEIVFCYLHAAAWALEAIDDAEIGVENKYSYSRLLYKLLGEVCTISNTFFDLATKSYVFRHAFGFAYYANVFNLDSDMVCVKKYLNQFLFGCSVLPLLNTPLVMSSEAPVLFSLLKELATKYYENIKNMMNKPCKDSYIDYAYFESKYWEVNTDRIG
jgi:hypothetical protein